MIATENKKRTAPKKPKSVKTPAALQGLSSYIKGEFLKDEKTIQALPFILFLLFLALLYIGNAYMAEKKVVQQYNLNKEIKELHSEFIAIKTELMNQTTQTGVAEGVQYLGLKESTVPPKVIKVSKKQKMKIE